MFFTTIICSRTAYAQTQPGLVQQDVIKISGITTDAQTWTLPATQKQTTRVYYDGLGRTLQTIGLQASPAGNDLIAPVAYDDLGRQTISYLPYAGKPTDASGSYRPNAIGADQPAFYDQTGQYLIPMDANPYAQKVFESSPLQRLLQAGMAGAGFQPGGSGTQHYKTVTYRPDSTAIDGNILQWNPDGSYTANTYYGNDALWVTDGVDEDLVETRTFVDLAGHTILKRQVLSSGNLDTYYIYNNAGMLIYTVPPNAVALLVPTTSFALTSAPLSNLVFYFVYDNMGRVVQKTVPAKGVAYIVYDPLNRPVLVQDANMRVNNNWSYIKYDVKGRAISQGIYNDATHTSLSAMQTYVSGLSYTVWYESRTAAGGATGYYTNLAFPTTGTTPLAYAYYDDYNMTESGSPDFTYMTQSDPKLPGEEMATGAQLKGMPTMVTQTTVGSGLTGTWLTTVTFYDRNLHPIQVRSNNHVYYTGYAASANLTDTKTVANDFTGMPLYSKVAKQTAATGGTTTVYTAITYDQVYRVTSVSQAYNSGAYAVVATYNYNELGQVIKKNLGQLSTGTIPATLNLNSTYSGTNTFVASSSITMSPGFSAPSGSTFKAYIATNYLQDVDYRYNIRGQVLSINNSKLSNDGGVTNTDTNDLFGMLFLYDQKDGNLNNTPSYDGKLSGVKWMSKDGSYNSSYERAFNYYYDAVNRDTAAIYNERPTASTNPFITTYGWDENMITYDPNGNIQTLYRNSAVQGSGGHTPIDNLTYTYSTTSPNQLASVHDATGNPAGFYGGTGTYSYDANGNLTNEPYKGISTIGYDVLNRTDKMTFTSSANRYITYTYDAGGNLIRKQQYDNVGGVATLQNTTDYLDGFVYTTVAGAQTLQYFSMPEGRVVNNSGTLTQEFIITDGQGNARISFNNTGPGGAAKVVQENSYYPFGLIMPGSAVGTPVIPNKQLYNGGSEWQNDYSNLPDYYQTFNRNYDAATGRFIGVDPAAESAESMTGYQYAGNIPTMLNDPDGSKPVPASYNYNYNYVSPLMPNAGPLDGDWEDQGAFQGPGGGSGDFSTFWNYVLSAAGDLINGLNNSTLSGIDFKNPDALYNLAFADPGSYNLSFSNGAATLTPTNEQDNDVVGADNSVANSGSTNQSTKSVSMGAYGTLNILQYTDFYNNQDYPKMGVTIQLGLNNTTGYKTLQWLQVVTTNYVGHEGETSPYYDKYRTNNPTPFAYVGTDYKSVYLNHNGYGFSWYDQPWRPEFGLNGGDDIFWKASLTLVGVVGNTYYPLFNINYGFSIQGGIYTRFPMIFTTPLFIPQTYNIFFPQNGP